MNQPVESQAPLGPELDALTAALATMPVAIMVTNSSGVVEWVNPHFTVLTGYGPEEIVGGFAWRHHGDPEAAASPGRLSQVVRTGEAWKGEIRWHCGQRSITLEGRKCDAPSSCCMEQTISPVRDAAGSVTHCLWTLHNVTRATQTAADLEQMQQMFQAAQQAAKFGVFRWNIKTGLSRWSPETYQLYGLDPTTTAPSFENWLRTIHEDDREKTLAAVNQSLENPDGRLNIQYRAVDGLHWISGNGQLYRDAEGRPDHMVGINMDVTERVRLESALRVSEERLGLAIDAVSDGIWDWNAETNEVYFSTSWKRMLGLDEDEVSANFAEWDRLVHPDDREQVYVLIHEHLDGKTEQYVAEYRMRCKDGSWKWILARGKVVARNPEGKALRVVGAHTDITRQRHLQAELQEREEQARSLFENLGEGVAYCRILFEGETAVDWLHEEVNDAYSGLTGIPNASGKRASELYPGLPTRHPELLEMYMRVCRSGEAERFEQFLEPLNAWFAGTVYGGPPDHFVVVFQNITAKKNAELALLRSHALLSNLARLVPGVIYQYRLWPDGRSAFPYASPGMFGIYEVTPDEVREDATPVFGRLHPEDADKVGQAIIDSARTLETFYSEFRVVLPGQGLRWRWSQAQPQRLEDGGTLWHGIILDVTERHKAEDEKARLTAQLIQAQKMESVGRLAGGVAHDFNNLLTVILGYSGFLMAKLKPNDPLHLYASEIGQAGNRAAGLTKQLLAFSRKQVIEPKLLNLNATIRESVPMLERLIGEDIEFRMHLKEDLGFTIADPDQIYQVIMNLAVNARDAMPNGGTLDISTANVELSQEEAHALDQEAMAGSYLAIAVADTGTGMDEETLQHIFEPFFTTKEEGKGTGLGLSTVFGIVRQSNGWIEVRSAPEAGTRFRIFLPRIDGGPPEEPKTADEVPKTGHETILIVEDQEGVRAFTKAVLLRQGYQVLEAAGGEEALLVAGAYSGRIHLLLTDVVLPGMNGKMVSDRLVALYPGIRVIFCSGYTADLIHQRGVAQHGTSFLQKPFRPENLIAKVREVLDSATHLPN